MKESKTPVVILVIVFSMLITISVVTLFVLKNKKSNESVANVQFIERNEVVVDFELSQLVKKAERLVNKNLAEAVQSGDVSIDFVSALRDDLEKAAKQLAKGEASDAESRYTDIASRAESKLTTLELANSARELKESVYTKLSASEPLKTAFENTYNEAISAYNQGLKYLESGDFESGTERFKMVEKILVELEKQSVRQLETQLEIAQKALSELDAATARASFKRVLEIEPSNKVAGDGLLKVKSMEAIAGEMESVRSLRSNGENKAALTKINALIEENPDNAYLLDERKDIETAISEDKRDALIKKAAAAEAEGDFVAAITALQEASKMRPDDKLTEQIKQLKARQEEKRLEILLETGYNALKAGNYEAAKKAYTEAMELNPKSDEALEGLEKTSSLYLANIRYDKSIESAARYLGEGRIPLATKFYNEALENRPSTLSFKQKDEEERIRKALAAQREKVNVLLVSDNKTFVSMIGVFAPERFKKKEIQLFPDIYTLKGARRNFQPVEFEVKVTGNMKPQGIEIECKEKR